MYICTCRGHHGKFGEAHAILPPAWRGPLANRKETRIKKRTKRCSLGGTWPHFPTPHISTFSTSERLLQMSTAVTAAYSFCCPIVQRKHLQGAAPQRLLKGRPGPFLCEAIREVRRAAWVDHGWPGSTTWGFWGSKNGEFNPQKWIKYDKMVISNMSWTMSWPKNVEVAWCHNQDLRFNKYEVLWSDWRQKFKGNPWNLDFTSQIKQEMEMADRAPPKKCY